MVEKGEKYTLVDLQGSIGSPSLRNAYKMIAFPVESLLGIRRLNKGYDRVTDRAKSEHEFINLVKRDIGVDFDLPDEEELRPVRKIKGPLVVVSNHPFGGIESFVIVQLLGLIRSDYRIISNFLLLRIRELQRVLFPVDPYETSNARRKNVNQLKKLVHYLKRDGMIHVFPAGEVSSYKLKNRRIEDRHWNESICRLIRMTGATVIPLYFHGRNSLFFQLVGFLNPYIRTAFLAREFVYPREKFIRYRLGKAIEPETINQYASDKELAAFLKSRTYELSGSFNDGE